MILEFIAWLETRIELNKIMLSDGCDSYFDRYLKADNTLMEIIIGLLEEKEVD